MLKLSISLLLLSLFTINAQAASVPQISSTGADGAFSLLNDDTLFSNTSNIYNFTDFNIAAGATLNVNNSDTVYIYSEQSIIINGALTSNSPDLHLIAPTITLGSLTATGSVVVTGQNFNISTGELTTTNPNNDNGVTIGSGTFIGSDLDLTNPIGTGIIILDPSISFTIPTNPINVETITFVTTPSPVPLPGALWLMMSGIIGFGLLKRRPQKR